MSDDYASTELRGRLDDGQLAFALGVKRSELDEIAAGRIPEGDTAQRLTMLYELGADLDLSDPHAAVEALGLPVDQARALPLTVTALLSRRRTLLLAFLVVDLLIGVAVAVVVLSST